MGLIRKVIVEGGGLAVGLAGTGVMALVDLKKKKDRKKGAAPQPALIKPKHRRVYLWPS